MFTWCALTGHDDLIVRAPQRLYLQCQVCGRETPGWVLAQPDRVLTRRRPETHNGRQLGKDTNGEFAPSF